jgi:serine/threonine protein kinase
VPGFTCQRDFHIAKGIESTIFLVSDEQKKTFIMKVMPKNKNSITEAQMLEKLKGKEYIAQKEAEGIQGDVHVIVMQYAERNSLETVLQSTDYFSDTFKTLDFFKKVIQGIRAIHREGYAHTQISIQSIVVTEDYNPLIINFCHATPIGNKKTVIGPENYLSSELVQAKSNNTEFEYTPEIDIFAAGVVLYYMNTKMFPFENSNGSYMTMMSLPIVFHEGCSSLFKSVIQKCLQKQSEMIEENDLIMYLENDISPEHEFPVENNYCYTLKSTQLDVFVPQNEISTVNHSRIYIIVFVVLLISVISFCFCQICLFFVWSKTSKNVISARPSEMNIDTTFIDSVNVSRIPGNQISKKEIKPDPNNI